MEPVIAHQPKRFVLFGLSKVHDPDKAYSVTIFELLDQVWAEVRSKNLSHTGLNHVVYDDGHIVFAGIELLAPPNEGTLLAKRDVILQKYAYCKHLGPYGNLDETHKRVQAAAGAAGEQRCSPTLEVYGHWNDDESKLETEIYYTLA